MRQASKIAEMVKEFVATAQENSLGLADGEKCFDAPLVGFSSGADLLHEEFRAHIGSFYWTPLALLQRTFPDLAFSPEQITVISWVLPATATTRAEQAAQDQYPSERWARTRAFGEACNNALRAHMVAALEKKSIPAVAPMLSPLWSRWDEGSYAPCSSWSERHAAYATGLGTFGLCDGLITPVGKAVRIGSVIAGVQIRPSPRPYTDRHAFCLHFTHNSCRQCVPRCPVNALSEAGHDKQRCAAYTEKAMNSYIQKAYGLNTYACGLCQARVPCTHGIPAPEGSREAQR